MGYSFQSFDAVLLLGAACLSAVFVVSACAKLRDTRRARDGLVAFGIAQRWSGPVVAVLVTLELLIAGLLALPATRATGAWSAIGALAVFSCAIAWQLAHGNRPACACFGALSRSTIGWTSIARNLALIALAGALLALPLDGPALAQATLDVPVLAALLWAAIGTAWLLQLTRQNGRLLLRIEQLEQAGMLEAGNSRLPMAQQGPLQPGDAVPRLGLSDTRGRPFEPGSLRGTPALILFLDAACTHCRPLLEQLQQRRTTGVALVVITERAELRYRLPDEATVLVDPGRASAAVFGVRGTPAALLLDADGALAQAAVHGTSPVRDILEQHSIAEVRHEWAPV